MYNVTNRPGVTIINRREAVEGEMLEQKVERIVNNKEPIKDGAPLIYIDRKEGIKASTNIRTDRWEVAIEATEAIAKSYKAKREERAGKLAEKEKEGEAQSIQGKETTTGNQ